MKPGRPSTEPTSAEFSQLVALYNAQRFVELESCVQALLRLYPASGFAWKLLGAAQQMQGKNALAAFQKTAELMPRDAEAHFNLGVVQKTQGLLREAADSYRRALKLNPNYVEAHTNLGNALKNMGMMEDSIACYRRALKLRPDAADVHNNLGTVLKDTGKTGEATDCYRRAIALRPDYADAYYNLGNALKDLGKLEEAADCYRNAIRIKPELAEAHNNLGYILKESDQLEAAAESYRRAAELNPNSVETHYVLGNILRDTKQFKKAAECYRRIATLSPDHVDALYNLGNTLQELGKYDEAIKVYQHLLTITPNFSGAYNNLGNALKELGQTQSALDCYRKALELKPDSINALLNLGITHKNLKQFDDATKSFLRALEIDPASAESHANLGALQTELGQFDNAVGSFRRSLELNPHYSEALSGLLFALCYINDHPPASYLAEARRYGKMVSRKAAVHHKTWPCAPKPQRLRVGIVSGDLRTHSVGRFIDGLVPHIDQTRIELIAYPTNSKEDELTARIKPFFSAWRPLDGISDEAAANLIHADGVHVLLDISGHTAHNRLPVFAWKPAPIQASWLGLPSTTGVAEIDYIIGDAVAIPPEHEQLLSEKVWRLPDCYVCFAPPDYGIEVGPLPALSTGYVTFGSFNNLSKMNDSVIELWARTLLAVPDSRLYLKAQQLNDTGIRERVHQRFSAWQIKPERILLGNTQGTIAEHLAEYHKVDIALDTFPYTGTTTNIEALWMGIPVLSLQGDRFLTRSATSISHHAGLPEWIARDKDDYVAKAVSFAADLKRLAARRAGLREQVLASPVFDVPRFARNFENALWGMWQAHLDRNKQT